MLFMWKGIGIWAVLWAFYWSPAVQAKDVAVDLELVLAVDISGSIDELEARLQREGYINAILHPDVLGAIKGGMLRRVAVTYVEWAGLYQQKLVDWHLIEDEPSARAFAQKLAEVPVFTSAWTSISGAINYALPLFEGNGTPACARSSTSQATVRTTRARRCPPPATARSPQG